MPQKRSSKKTKRRRDDGPHAPLAEHHHERGPWQDFVAGLLFFAALTTINIVWIEPSLVGQEIKRMAYAFIQARLAMTREDSPSEVAVVDITGLPPCKTGSGKDTVFPRQALKEALDAVLAQHPAAIGVDLDFAPGPNVSCAPSAPTASAEKIWDFTDRGGPQLFQFALGKDAPIFLGVFRTQDLTPSQWLGGEAYAKLAAALLVPPEKSVSEGNEKESEPDPIRGARRQAPLHAARGANPGRHASHAERCYVRKAFTGKDFIPPVAWRALPRWLAEDYYSSPKKRNGLAKTSLSTSTWLTSARLRNWKTSTPLSGKARCTFLQRRISPANLCCWAMSAGKNLQAVALNRQVRSNFPSGNEAEPDDNSDKFPLGSTGEMKAGVYWHACGADTLIRGVLAWPTLTGRLLLDTAFYLPVLLAILFLRLRYKTAVSAHKMESIFTKVMAVLVVIFGFFVINLTRLVWDDFVLVAVLVVLHPWLAEVAEKAILGLRSVASSALNRARA